MYEERKVQLPPDSRYRGGEDKDRRRERQREYEAKRKGTRSRAVDPRTKRMIAWDGEGMKLSGSQNPQHYVLFGCSAEPESPLTIGSDPKGDLTFQQLADYACDIADRYPQSFHIGYFFGYDQNMIVKTLSPWHKQVLHKNNSVQVTRGDVTYRVKWIPKKRITLTRIRDGKRSTITIDDIGTFFGRTFVDAYREQFPDEVDTPEFSRVVEGKAQRADTTFADMRDVKLYWRDEIQLLQRLAERFRAIMYEAGFILRDWYGPGALANYIRRTRKLADHEHGGKEPNMPREVHEASKHAYYGGRFEQFHAGRIQGPVYAYDIRSAYPYEFTRLPSMREGGEWVHVTTPTRGITMGVYRMSFRYKNRFPHPMMPLPYRSPRHEVSFPGIVEGWYWMPEAQQAYKLWNVPGRDDLLVEIHEGWEWHPADNSERPWAFLHDMYAYRNKLKAHGSPAQMAYKLGPNSLYGKAAQKVGWDERSHTPPRAHTLPIAGWITAACRAEILTAARFVPPDDLVAIETDGFFTTRQPPIDMTIGENLGEWEVKTYDEIIYVQSGVYLTRQGDTWSVKSRGKEAASLSVDTITDYLARLTPDVNWREVDLQVPQSEQFVSIGSAISRAREGGKGVNPFKLNRLHCRWEPADRRITVGELGKRVHIPELCHACKSGLSANDGRHPLLVRAPPAAMKHDLSTAYSLPWESGETETERLNRERDEYIQEHEA